MLSFHLGFVRVFVRFVVVVPGRRNNRAWNKKRKKGTPTTTTPPTSIRIWSVRKNRTERKTSTLCWEEREREREDWRFCSNKKKRRSRRRKKTLESKENYSLQSTTFTVRAGMNARIYLPERRKKMWCIISRCIGSSYIYIYTSVLSLPCEELRPTENVVLVSFFLDLDLVCIISI